MMARTRVVALYLILFDSFANPLNRRFRDRARPFGIALRQRIQFRESVLEALPQKSLVRVAVAVFLRIRRRYALASVASAIGPCRGENRGSSVAISRLPSGRVSELGPRSKS